MAFFLNRLFASDSTSDFSFIDDYLTRWDRFAQGENQFLPGLKTDKDRFITELSTAVSSGDKRAMSRVVFYAVVQIAGFPYDSPLGKSVEKIVSPEVQVSTEGDEKTYYAGDLYFWWEKHKKDYVSFPLYEELIQRDFAKKTTIPMYTAISKQASN